MERISLYLKFVLFCPHCNEKIKVAPESKRWLILVFPLLLIIIWAVLEYGSFPKWLSQHNVGLLEWSAVVLAFFGVTMGD